MSNNVSSVYIQSVREALRRSHQIAKDNCKKQQLKLRLDDSFLSAFMLGIGIALDYRSTAQGILFHEERCRPGGTPILAKAVRAFAHAHPNPDADSAIPEPTAWADYVGEHIGLWPVSPDLPEEEWSAEPEVATEEAREETMRLEDIIGNGPLRKNLLEPYGLEVEQTRDGTVHLVPKGKPITAAKLALDFLEAERASAQRHQPGPGETLHRHVEYSPQPGSRPSYGLPELVNHYFREACEHFNDGQPGAAFHCTACAAPILRALGE
jgi:hypothetical protein